MFPSIQPYQSLWRAEKGLLHVIFFRISENNRRRDNRARYRGVKSIWCPDFLSLSRGVETIWPPHTLHYFFSKHPTLSITLTCRNRPVTYHHFSHIQKQSTTPQSRTRPRRQINKMSSFLCLFADPEITCPGFSWMKSCSHIRKCLTRRRDRTRPRRRINMTSSCIALRVCQVSNSFNYYDVPQPQAHYISLFSAYIRKISPTR